MLSDMKWDDNIVSDMNTNMTSDTKEASPHIVSDTNYPPFDTSKYVLGKLCPRRHEYHGTGKSLLTIKGRKCLACNAELRRAKRAAKHQAASA